jgi:DNA primase
MLEREVLKARVQLPALVTTWSSIEDGAFTHPAYASLAATINSLGAARSITSEEIADPQMKALFTELSVEPIRAEGEITERYVASIVARLREVGASRAIADLKSRLQRLNPVENGDEYNAAFAQLVALESTRRTLHELAVGSL